MKLILKKFYSRTFTTFSLLKNSIQTLFMSKYGSNNYIKGILLCITFLKGTYMYKILKWIIRIIAWVNILLGLSVLTLYVDIGIFHITYINIYHDMYTYIYIIHINIF